MPLPKTPHYTEDDYYALPEDVRAELIDGQIYYQAAPNRRHQKLVSILHAAIFQYIQSKGGSCEVYPAPFAVKLRSLFAGMGYDPKIQAIVYRTDKKQALKGVTNFKKQAYDVDYIGDIETSYSEAVILNSDVERKALARHLKWGQERDFWQYDYNYKSSIASAIHRDMKQRCGIPGIEKDPSQRTDEELWNIRVLEHCRWNAYMRSEGYVYSGSLDPSTRNDLAKKHHCLVPFEQLPLKEQEKDDD